MPMHVSEVITNVTKQNMNVMGHGVDVQCLLNIETLERQKTKSFGKAK